MKKQLKEWGVILVVIIFLYVTGLHTDVAALAQRAVLSTGLITANTELPHDMEKEVDYNFSLQTLNGNVVKLSDFKGKIIFINVWATWCPPCVAEMPDIQNLYDQVDKEKIIFVMLSMDDHISKAQKFIDKKKFTFPVYMPASKIPEIFRSNSIPTTYVISAEGKLVAKKVGMAKYNTKSFIEFLEKEALKVTTP